MKCPDPNCNIVMARSRLENHLSNECQWRVVVCDYCEDKYAVCKEEVYTFGKLLYIWKVVIHLETVVRYSVCYLSAVANPGVGDTQGKYRYPA